MQVLYWILLHPLILQDLLVKVGKTFNMQMCGEPCPIRLPSSSSPKFVL